MRLHFRELNRTANARQSLERLCAAAVFVVVLSSIGGCQGRRDPLEKTAQILLDSLLAGNEAMYDSATANLAWDRLTCLDSRAFRLLGDEEGRRLALKAERIVRAKHSRAEYLAGERGIAWLHDAPTEPACRRVDSLWYATVVNQRKKSP